MENGHLDDVDYFLSSHIFSNQDSSGDDVMAGMNCRLATCKYDVIYRGKAANAGTIPQLGRNALMAAVTAVQNLMSISRYVGGTSLINVGKLSAGIARNVIPDEAVMEVEVRGDSAEILTYLQESALRVIQGAAQIHGCEAEISVAGEAETLLSDPIFAEKIADTLARYAPKIQVSPIKVFESPGSEDASLMLNRVRSRGGTGSYMRFLTDLKTGVHERRYDFDEQILPKGIQIFTVMVCALLKDNIL